MKTVIGIDPGLASLGWGIIQYNDNSSTAKFEYIAHGVISTPSDIELHHRLLTLDVEFDRVMRRYQVEELAYEYQFFVKNVTSALPVAHALGIILLYGAKHSISVSHYTPKDVKKQITGNANASKHTVNTYVCLPLRVHQVTPHHAADALAVALTHIFRSQSNTILKKSSNSFNTEDKKM